MTFSTELLVGCIALPAVIAFIAAWASGRIAGTGDVAATTSPWNRTGAASLVAATGWCLAMLASLATGYHFSESDQSFSAWVFDDEAWRSIIAPLFVLALAACGMFAVTEPWNGWRMLLVGLGSTWLAYMVLPTGDGWVDTLPLHRTWFALVVASVLLNTASFQSLHRSGAGSWLLLVGLAGLGPAMLLTALNYAAPAQWCLAAISATLACQIVVTLRGAATLPSRVVSAVFYPLAGAIAALTTTSRFYTWEDYPAWLYAVALFAPTCIAVTDIPIRRRPWWLRVPVAALIAGLLIGVCVWQLLLTVDDTSW
ncbi:hypothetical protein [Crateriforma spongiae]|uniref:hypothetical protein n=1 Tax=Crateriforma spongiae TaxID=2724528 RepID=UPI0039AF0634